MIRRRRARQVVLQLLYQTELNPHSTWDWRAFCNRRLHQDEDLTLLAQTLFLGVRQNQTSIDQTIQKALTRWNLERLGLVDRNLIRLATYEMLHQQVPHKIAINEAIELAKQFGGQNSPGFVNGALDRVFRNHSDKSIHDQAQVAATESDPEAILTDDSSVKSTTDSLPMRPTRQADSALARWNRRRPPANRLGGDARSREQEN